jgi:hypothetical protein
VQDVTEILLWLFVMNLGIAFGAGIYEQRIIVPQWFSLSPEAGFRVNSEAMRQTDTGRRFWAYVTTVPLTLLTLGSLVVAWQAHGARYEWWLGAAVIVLAERIMTLSYFIPTALKLMRAETLPEATATAMASQWANWNYARISLTLAAWIAALEALSLPSVHGSSF